VADRPFRFGVVAAFAPNREAWLAKARRIEELGSTRSSAPSSG
jgi:hypothetical protein